jgi:hypothetical protein
MNGQRIFHAGQNEDSRRHLAASASARVARRVAAIARFTIEAAVWQP